MSDIESINNLKDDERLAAIEERASMIASQLNSATDPATIKSLGDAAKMLMSMIPQGNSRTGTVTSRVEGVISAAEKKEAEADIDETSVSFAPSRSGARSAGSLAFQQALYKFMTDDEKAYFDKFQTGTQYKMATINEDGTITEQTTTVDGAQIKEDFARVKSYTLPEEQQENITLPDGQKMRNMPPAEEKKELDKLTSSLGNLEGQGAQELMQKQKAELQELMRERAAPEVIEEVQEEQKKEAREFRGKFMKVRESIARTTKSLDEVAKAQEKGWKEAEVQAKSALKSNKDSLRSDIRDAFRTLVENSDDNNKQREGRDRKGREKDNDFENQMVTPANTRAGGIRARDAKSRKEAEGAIMGAKDDEQVPEKTAAIGGMKDVADRDLAALSPTAVAGETRRSSREVS